MMPDTAPVRRSRSGISSTACGVVRSPRPTRTAAAEQVTSQCARIHLLEEVAQDWRERGALVALVDDTIEQPLAGGVVPDGLCQELSDEDHLDAVLAEGLREDVVLLPCPLDTPHVVVEQVRAVRRREAVQLQVGAVQQHAAESSDL